MAADAVSAEFLAALKVCRDKIESPKSNSTVIDFGILDGWCDPQFPYNVCNEEMIFQKPSSISKKKKAWAESCEGKDDAAEPAAPNHPEIEESQSVIEDAIIFNSI